MLCRTDKTEDGTDIYIGSTSQRLERRLCRHRYRAKNFLEQGYSENNRLYKQMNDVGIKKWQVIPLLTFAWDQKTIYEFEKSWVKALTRILPLRTRRNMIQITAKKIRRL